DLFEREALGHQLLDGVDPTKCADRVDPARSEVLALLPDPPRARDQAQLHIAAQVGLGESDVSLREGRHDLLRGQSLRVLTLDIPDLGFGETERHDLKRGTEGERGGRREVVGVALRDRLQRSCMTVIYLVDPWKHFSIE